MASMKPAPRAERQVSSNAWKALMHCLSSGAAALCGVADSSCRWWRNSDRLLKAAVLTNACFDRLDVLRLS